MGPRLHETTLFHLTKMILRVGKIIQSVKCLVCKREDLSSIPKTHLKKKKSQMWRHTVVISKGRHSQVDPRDSVLSMLGEREDLKDKVGVSEGRQPRLSYSLTTYSYTHKHTCVHERMRTNVHTHTHFK